MLFFQKNFYYKIIKFKDIIRSQNLLLTRTKSSIFVAMNPSLIAF